ncbi:hypothetical protein M5W76_19175 [Paenibacillus larvae]|uniref:Uncharacterized protein n=8 Tax=Fernvirus TaxID=2843380 RepID=R9VYB0_9CAUD|nr:hypothetical protein [Paenibacillus larvae]YP_008320392.1 hypothetical protein IBBPl23_53 [Paenibacillus phage phiIBB_P123]YP_009203256.1 hypothetical protein FERN_54 [Paenibacillus phage Fern]YP_009593463.1 hypothetical protein FDG84_gp54 [Paenibacillus phage Willow]YP_009836389.1 hypothetical protein HWB44_gp59 [Paenibacillus phage PBL1c]YP_009838688.1 hypothetical protein HWB70_gp57 [Paenibacillus phage Yyerffej]YP_009838822.1 hypothetical protein HWB72_gp51 [Paenibacillus phage Luciell
MELIEERNGFKIYRREESELGYFSSMWYVVFHRDFNGVWINEYENIDEAEKFCDKEDADYWENQICKF